MPKRPTAFPGNRPTASESGKPTASAPCGSRNVRECGHDGTPREVHSGFRISRALTLWLADCKAQGGRPAVLYDRRKTLERFCWWLEHEVGEDASLEVLSRALLRDFLIYAREPHPTGRWGSSRASASREARPATVQAAYRILRAFFNFCLAEGLLSVSPLESLPVPKVPEDQVQPFSPDQLQLLLDASKRSKSPERNVAINMILVDTGLRVCELLRLRVRDADRSMGELVVTGKGNKRRTVFIGLSARRALWKYLEADRRQAELDSPLFTSVGGHYKGTGLSHTGIHEVVSKAGEAAGLTGLRCSPHVLRHTFAVNFLRNGGNVYELQQIMGHSDLKILRRYVALAAADLADAHRRASPADRMKLR